MQKCNIPTTEACNTDTAANNIIPFYNNPAAAADMDRRFAHILDHRNFGKYNIPTTNAPGTEAGAAANNTIPFYNNPAAAADMDRRFAHILDHRNFGKYNIPTTNAPGTEAGAAANNIIPFYNNPAAAADTDRRFAHILDHRNFGKYNIPTIDAPGTEAGAAANNIIPFYNDPAAAADMDRRFAHILDHRNFGKYNIPTTDAPGTEAGAAANNIIPFYNDPAAAADMDRRFAHILDHQNPFFNNRPWSSLSEAILGFDIQNEGQAHSPNHVIANRDWICSRAKLVKPKLSAGILVMTGGGADIWDSVIIKLFQCPAINVNAKKYGKRMILQEFGSTGAGKSSSLNSRILASMGLGLPWMVWQVMSPNNFNDFETFTNDAASWAVLTDRARQVNSGDDSFNAPGIFAWPELPRGTPGPGPGPG
eukprot:gene10272-8192_t